MISKVISFALNGLEGIPIEVETDVSLGIPSYDIVGLPDTAVKESRERVRSAIKNSGYDFPSHRVTVNMAPADVKKEGSDFDLAVAVSILKSNHSVPFAAGQNVALFGELGLDGTLRKITGLLPVLISAREAGVTEAIVPYANREEAKYVDGISVYPASSLKEAVNHLLGILPLTPVSTVDFETFKNREDDHDISFVRGQKIAKRALEVAVSGGHNLLFIGPPGTGKTMLARSVPSIMPDLMKEEALEITKIHSVAGSLGEEGIVTKRPFRTPHHTATQVSLCGGGNNKIHPGEISLAHGGVLFLDELPEYSRATLESLRQPLEDGVITISRASGTVTYPARFMLIAGMNPCPCGNYGSDSLTCTCTPLQIKRYRERISGPLLDRIDIQVDLDAVSYFDVTSEREEESGKTVKARVDLARKIQAERFINLPIHTNAEMSEREIRQFCKLDSKSEEFLRKAFEKFRLSMRARARILKVARTIADLDCSESICFKHLAEAVGLRTHESESL